MCEKESSTLEDELSGERAGINSTVSRQEDVSKRKATGAFYTPPELADFVVDLGLSLRNTSEQISALDPSVGGGVFLDSIAQRFQNEPEISLELVGVDIEERALAATEDALATYDQSTMTVNLAHDDFFRWRWSAMDVDFDLIVGNPPWGLTSSEANGSPIYRELSLDFVHHSLQLLDDNGCLSLLLPGTWVFSRSDAEFRNFLLGLNRSIEIYQISPDWFPDATFTIEPVVLVVGSKAGEQDPQLSIYDAASIPISSNQLYQLPLDRFHDYPAQKFPIAPASFHRFIDGSELSNITTPPELGYQPYSGVKTYANKTYVYDAASATEGENNGDVEIRMSLDDAEKQNGVESDCPVLIPYDKGGRTRDEDWTAFWTPTRHYLRWDAEAVTYYRSKGGLRNEETYFTDGIHFSSSGRNCPVFRLSTGLVYDADFPFVPVEGQEQWELLSLLNSPPCMYLIKHCINPTAHFKNQDFEDVPVPTFKQMDTDGLVNAGRQITEARKGEGRVPIDMYRKLSKESAELYGFSDDEEEAAWNWFECARLKS
jgi:predicted RNA methylase